MAEWTSSQRQHTPPDEEAIARSIAEHETPFSQRGKGLESIREALYTTMWEKVGILRQESDLTRAQQELQDMAGALATTGLGTESNNVDRAYNLTWHDWMNLRNLIQVSRAVTVAALAREDSRGAHFREDFPETRHLEQSAFTAIRAQGDALSLSWTPVKFTRVKPGDTILQDA